MVSKERLYQLIDRLPEEAVPEAERILEKLSRPKDEGLPRFLAEAPWDDEPVTDEERGLIEEGYEDLRRGDVVSMDEIRREFGP